MLTMCGVTSSQECVVKEASGRVGVEVHLAVALKQHAAHHHKEVEDAGSMKCRPGPAATCDKAGPKHTQKRSALGHQLPQYTLIRPIRCDATGGCAWVCVIMQMQGLSKPIVPQQQQGLERDSGARGQ